MARQGKHFAGGQPREAVARRQDREEPEDVAPAVESRDAQVGRSAALMSVLVIVSRLTGFLRTWGQAYALGVTVTASCYSVANNLPNQLYELVIGGMLVTAFLPVYQTVKKEQGTRGASDYTSNLVSIVLLLMGAVTVAGFVFASQVVWTQSFSASADFDADLATYFFRFFVIEVVLYALSSIFSGVLNAERDYFWSSAAPIFNNFVTTASFLAYAFLLESQPGLALVLLALGNPLGVAVQVVMQMPSLAKHGIRLRPHINWRDPALRDTLSIGIPSLLVMVCSFVTVSVMNSSALSVTAVGASVSYYARLWYTLPYAILAVPITTAMFTELSDDVARGDMDAYREGVSSGTSKVCFFMVPFMMYLMVFSAPLITMLAAGKFSDADIAMTASYLRALAVSLPVYGICMYLQKVCSSLRRMGLFAVANIVAAGVQVAICLFATPHFGLDTVALSSAFFFLAVDVVTFASLRKTLGRMGLSSVAGSIVRATALGLVGAATGWGVLYLLSTTIGPIGQSISRALVFTVAGGIPSVLVTFGLALLLRIPEVSVISSLMGRLLRRR